MVFYRTYQIKFTIYIDNDIIHFKYLTYIIYYTLTNQQGLLRLKRQPTFEEEGNANHNSSVCGENSRENTSFRDERKLGVVPSTDISTSESRVVTENDATIGVNDNIGVDCDVHMSSDIRESEIDNIGSRNVCGISNSSDSQAREDSSTSAVTSTNKYSSFTSTTATSTSIKSSSSSCSNEPLGSSGELSRQLLDDVVVLPAAVVTRTFGAECSRDNKNSWQSSTKYKSALGSKKKKSKLAAQCNDGT